MQVSALLRLLLSREIRPYVLLSLLVLATHFGTFAYFSHLASGNPAAAAYPVVQGDSVYYTRLAESLRTQGEFVEPLTPLAARVWPPGYPFIMAVTKAVTGSYLPLIFIQIGFAALAVCLLYKMALRFAPARFALAAAALYALEPMAMFLNTTLFTDGLFSSLLLITVYIALFQDRWKGVRLWAAVGLLLGLLTMLKPVAFYLIFLAPLVLLIKEHRELSLKKKLIAFSVFVLCAALLIVPWMERNHRVHGVFEITSSSKLNLMHNFARPYLAWRSLDTWSAVDALLAQRRVETPAFDIADAQLDARLATVTPPGEDWWEYQGTVAVDVILEEPVRYAYFHAINMVPFFLSSSVSAYHQYVRQIGSNTDFYAPTLIALMHTFAQLPQASLAEMPGLLMPVAPIGLEIIFWVIVVSLALFYTLYTLRRPTLSVLVLACLIAYFAALTGPIAMPRYRVPVAPYLFILAAAGAGLVSARRRSSVDAARAREVM